MKIEYDLDDPTRVVIDGETYDVASFDYSLDPTYERVTIEWVHLYRHARTREGAN